MKNSYLTAVVCALAVVAASCSKPATKQKEKEIGPAPATFRTSMKTTKGDVVILVHRDWAPNGADRFYELNKIHFYDGTYFFRCLKGFIVQWGINGDPSTNRVWSELTIKDDPKKVSNREGTVVFAAAGPDSRTTQVFINLGNNSKQLDGQGFTPFGEVIQGMENVNSFYMGYGEGPPGGSGPDQSVIANQGTSYVEERFPKMDHILKVTVLEP